MRVFDPVLFFQRRGVEIARFEGEVGEIWLVLRGRLILTVPAFFRSIEWEYVQSHFIQSVIRGYKASLRQPLISFNTIVNSPDAYYELEEPSPVEPPTCSCGGLLVCEENEVYCERCGLVYSIDRFDLDKFAYEAYEKSHGRFNRIRHRRWRISGAIQS